MLARDLLAPLSPGPVLLWSHTGHRHGACLLASLEAVFLSLQEEGSAQPPPSALSPERAARHVVGLNKDEGWDRGMDALLLGEGVAAPGDRQRPSCLESLALWGVGNGPFDANRTKPQWRDLGDNGP